MEIKRFICEKAYPAADLQRTAAFFGLPLPEARENAVIVEGEKLSEIYKYDVGRKKIHIFVSDMFLRTWKSMRQTGFTKAFSR